MGALTTSTLCTPADGIPALQDEYGTTDLPRPTALISLAMNHVLPTVADTGCRAGSTESQDTYARRPSPPRSSLGSLKHSVFREGVPRRLTLTVLMVNWRRSEVRSVSMGISRYGRAAASGQEVQIGTLIRL